MTSAKTSVRAISSRMAQTTLNDLFNLRMFGFACARGWVLLMFLGVSSSSATWFGDEIPGYTFLISTTCLCVTLFLCALSNERFTATVKRLEVRLVLLLLMVLGTACIAFAPVVGCVLPLNVIGGVTTGIGSAVCDLGYAAAYRETTGRSAALETPLAFLLASAILALSSGMPPQGVVILVLVLPVVSALILLLPLEIWRPENAPRAKPRSINITGYWWRIGACACLVGIADSTIRSAFLTNTGDDLHSIYCIPMVLSSTIILVVVYTYLLLKDEVDYQGIYRFYVVVMAFFFMLLPVFNSVGLVQETLAITGYNTFNCLIWILIAEITYTYRLASAITFGIGWGMVSLGVLLGNLVAEQVSLMAPFSPQTLSLLTVAATGIIFISYLFVFKEEDIIALTATQEDKLTIERLRNEVFVGEQTLSAEFIPGENPSCADCPYLPQNASRNAGEAPQPPPAEDSRPRQAEDTEAGCEDDAHQLPFDERCHQVAEQFLLTQREAEIMTLYAKGRSAARIQEELFLSRGTVNTHLRHIYQKMGIHSKQDLLDVLDGHYTAE